MQTIEAIKSIIKEEILINRLELEDITAEEIEDDLPLFGEGLGLDSVEALDIIAGLEQIFDVKLQAVSAEELRKHLYAVETLSRFVFQQLEINSHI